MRSRSARILVGILAFFAPTYVAVTRTLLDGSPAAESSAYRLLIPLAYILSVVIAAVPALFFLRSGLPPNTRLGLAIVMIALLIGECLSILYIAILSGMPA